MKLSGNYGQNWPTHSRLQKRTSQPVNIYKRGFLLWPTPQSEQRLSYLLPGTQEIHLYRAFRAMLDFLVAIALVTVLLIVSYHIEDD